MFRMNRGCILALLVLGFAGKYPLASPYYTSWGKTVSIDSVMEIVQLTDSRAYKIPDSNHIRILMLPTSGQHLKAMHSKLFQEIARIVDINKKNSTSHFTDLSGFEITQEQLHELRSLFPVKDVSVSYVKPSWPNQTRLDQAWTAVNALLEDYKSKQLSEFGRQAIENEIRVEASIIRDNFSKAKKFYVTFKPVLSSMEDFEPSSFIEYIIQKFVGWFVREGFPFLVLAALFVPNIVMGIFIYKISRELKEIKRKQL